MSSSRSAPAEASAVQVARCGDSRGTTKANSASTFVRSERIESHSGTNIDPKCRGRALLLMNGEFKPAAVRIRNDRLTSAPRVQLFSSHDDGSYVQQRTQARKNESLSESGRRRRLGGGASSDLKLGGSSLPSRPRRGDDLGRTLRVLDERSAVVSVGWTSTLVSGLGASSNEVTSRAGCVLPYGRSDTAAPVVPSPRTLLGCGYMTAAARW